MRRACIDIGSNTTRLLVADCGDGVVSPCHEQRAFTQLGRSLDGSGRIPPAKLEEVAAAVAEQAASARVAGVAAAEVHCVMTAAGRRAGNVDQLIDAVAACADGLAVELLSEAQEAHYTFIGAQSQFTEGEPSELRAVVDVGGGSSEIAIGRAPETVAWWTSVPVGSSDLAALGLAADPPTEAEIAVAAARAAGYVAELEPPRPAAAVAVGGSAGSLRRVAGDTLDHDSLSRALAAVTRAPAASVAAATGLEVDRARILPAGLLILDAIVALLGVPLRVGSAGLREGVLLAAAAAGPAVGPATSERP